MGFKDDVRAKAEELDRRVTALETLAEQIKGGPLTNGRMSTLPTRTPGATVTASHDNGPRANGVDYGAVAFGLSEIKRKVAGLVSSGSRSTMAHEYEGAVQYFADVFAKADPSFDEASFRRQAGV